MSSNDPNLPITDSSPNKDQQTAKPIKFSMKLPISQPTTTSALTPVVPATTALDTNTATVTATVVKPVLSFKLPIGTNAGAASTATSTATNVPSTKTIATNSMASINIGTSSTASIPTKIAFTFKNIAPVVDSSKTTTSTHSMPSTSLTPSTIPTVIPSTTPVSIPVPKIPTAPSIDDFDDFDDEDFEEEIVVFSSVTPSASIETVSEASSIEAFDSKSSQASISDSTAEKTTAEKTKQHHIDQVHGKYNTDEDKKVGTNTEQTKFTEPDILPSQTQLQTKVKQSMRPQRRPRKGLGSDSDDEDEIDNTSASTTSKDTCFREDNVIKKQKVSLGDDSDDDKDHSHVKSIEKTEITSTSMPIPISTHNITSGFDDLFDLPSQATTSKITLLDPILTRAANEGITLGRMVANGEIVPPNWICCDEPSCGKWRKLPGIIGEFELESLQLGAWCCYMHPMPRWSSCLVPEEQFDQ